MRRKTSGAPTEIDEIDRIALGSWKNEETYWKGLVEGKKLHHLGEPDTIRNALRDRLALGPVVFAGRPPGLSRLSDFIMAKTATFLTNRTLHRVSFDLTNLENLSGEIGEGLFAIFELKLVVGNGDLFEKTSFYEGGKYLNWKRTRLRRRISDILSASEAVES